MSGIIYVEQTSIEAATDHMLLTFSSGGDEFRFRLSRHLALRFRLEVQRESWPVEAAPDCEIHSIGS